MKPAAWIGLVVAAVIVGFLVGGIGPGREVADLRADITELRGQLLEAQKKANRRGSSRFMPLPGLDALPAPPPRTTPNKERSRRGDGPPWMRDDDAEDPAVTPTTPEQAMEAFETAVSAQRIRAAQSRAALAEQAKLDDSEMKDVDTIVDALNDALAEYSDEILDIVEEGENPDTTKMLGLSHEITGILYESQTQLDDVIGEDNLPNVDDPARQIWNYIDLDIFRDAAENFTGQE